MLYSTNQQTLSYMETTPAYLMAGASADTTITQSMLFSRAFTLSSNQLHTPYPSSLAMSPARTTLLTHRPEESTAPPISSCLPWTSLSMLGTSSLTAPTPSQPASSESSTRADTQLSPHEPLTKCTPSSRRPSVPELRPSSRTSSSSTSSKTIESILSCFNFPLPFPNPSASKSTTEHRPFPYPPNLHLLPSPNRPHCLAKDRLHLWISTLPSTRMSLASSDVVSDIALNCILEVIGASWVDSTKELYGTGLLIFHMHCNINNILEIEHCPISHPILLAFLSSCAGAYSGSAISNYAASICAWHLLHGHAWLVEPNELKLTLQGAMCLAPHASKHPKHPPMTINDIKAIWAFLNLDDLCNAAIYACMVVVFYSVAQLGEFTVTAITKFDAAKHVTCRNVSFLEDQHGLPVIKFTLPSTKCAPDGEDVQCVPQKAASQTLKQPYKTTSASTLPHLTPTFSPGNTQRTASGHSPKPSSYPESSLSPNSVVSLI